MKITVDKSEDNTDEQKFNRKLAAKFLGVSIITVDRLVLAKKLGHFRIGKRVIFSKEHLDAFLATCEQKTKKKAAMKSV